MTMKKLSFIPILLISLYFASCEKDEDQQTETVNLQIDGYVEQGNRTFVATMTAGEEVAITLGPVVNTFQVTYITFLFGGTGQTVVNRDVILKIYKDNGSVNPGDLLYSGNYTLSSSNTLLQQLDIRNENVTYNGGGSIRVSFEFVDGTGFPAFAQEFVGLYDPNKNWIKDSGGTWMTNDGIGLNGNWVIRATVEENI